MHIHQNQNMSGSYIFITKISCYLGVNGDQYGQKCLKKSSYIAISMRTKSWHMSDAKVRFMLLSLVQLSLRKIHRKNVYKYVLLFKARFEMNWPQFLETWLHA